MTITELAKKLNITTSALRYYESIGLTIADRDEKGNRNYTDTQVKRAQRVAYFRHAGVQISDLKVLFADEMSDKEAIAMMEKAHSNLEDQQRNISETLAFLDYKLNYHKKRLKQN